MDFNVFSEVLLKQYFIVQNGWFFNKYLGSLNSLAGPKMAKQLIQAGNKGILRPKRKNEYNLLDYVTTTVSTLITLTTLLCMV